MKKIIGILFILVLLSPMALAQNRALTQNVSVIGQQITREMRHELRKQTPEGIRQIIQERRGQIEQEIEDMDLPRRKAFRNQNEVRLAVHALLEMDNLTGGIGPQIREVARNFNNSVQATLNAEERIERRGGFVRLFAGGDAEAAEEIEEQVNQSQQRIQQLKQLREDCPCSEEVKALMQEQIQQMEQEQDRLRGLAQAEKQSKGLLGWIWK